jgi:hypothetical protein
MTKTKERDIQQQQSTTNNKGKKIDDNQSELQAIIVDKGSDYGSFNK